MGDCERCRQLEARVMELQRVILEIAPPRGIRVATSDMQEGAPTNVVPRNTRIADLLAEDPRVLLAILDGLTDDQRKRLHTAISEPDGGAKVDTATMLANVISAMNKPDGGAGELAELVDAAVEHSQLCGGFGQDVVHTGMLRDSRKRLIDAVAAYKGEIARPPEETE